MKLAVLGDLHYSDYATADLEAARDRVFRHWFAQLQTLKPDWIIAVGDVTQWGKPTELEGLQRIVQDLQLPFMAIPGNHDCYTLSKSELHPYFLGSQRSLSQDALYCSVEREGIHFIFLDTAKPREAKDYGGWITTEQTQWLARQIEHYNQRQDLSHFVVFAHHPLQNTTRGSEEPKLNIENSADLFPVLAQLRRTPGYYFCGHNHRHSQVQWQQWQCIQSAAPWDCLSFHWVEIPTGNFPLTVERRDFEWEHENLAADWRSAHDTIPHFTPKSWEVANNL